MSPVSVPSLGIAEVQMLFILILLAILIVYPWAKILEKAGKSRLLALLIFIPFGLLILPWYLALTDWRR